VGLVATGYDMAEVLASRVAGRKARYRPAPRVTKLKLDVLEVAVVGQALVDDPGYRGLEVREDNRRAISIYEKAGFQRVGEEPNYYEDGMTAVRMTRVVSRPKVSAGTSATSGKATPLSGTTHKTPGRALS